MNIEEILPELFGEKRIYYCQRCLNHGLDIKRKNHKADCIYRFCTCNDCQANAIFLFLLYFFGKLKGILAKFFCFIYQIDLY